MYAYSLYKSMSEYNENPTWETLLTEAKRTRAFWFTNVWIKSEKSIGNLNKFVSKTFKMTLLDGSIPILGSTDSIIRKNIGIGNLMLILWARLKLCRLFKNHNLCPRVSSGTAAIVVLSFSNKVNGLLTRTGVTYVTCRYLRKIIKRIKNYVHAPRWEPIETCRYLR